jgi:parallel beta-helix repeat protein
MNQARTATSWPATVRTQGASNVTFSNNRVHDNYGEGIDLLQSNNSFAVNNIVWDNYSAEIYLDNTTKAIANANLVYNTGDTRF